MLRVLRLQQLELFQVRIDRRSGSLASGKRERRRRGGGALLNGGRSSLEKRVHEGALLFGDENAFVRFRVALAPRFFPFLTRIELDLKSEEITRPAWAGFKTAEEGIAIIMSYIL